MLKAKNIKFENRRGKSPLQYEKQILQKISENSIKFKFIGYNINTSEEWNGYQTYIILECTIHGIWSTTNINSFLNGRGCNKCSNKIGNTEKFISDARNIHSSKYDYSKVEYISSKKKL